MADTFLLKPVDLTTTDATTIYTCPTTNDSTVPPTDSTVAIIKSIRVANDHSSDNIDITLTITRNSAVYAIETLKTINAKTSSEILSMPLVANEGDIIKATAATADRLHVLLSVMEIT